MTRPVELRLGGHTRPALISILHRTNPVEYRHGCDTNAPAVKIFHGAKHAKNGEQKTRSTKSEIRNKFE